MLSKIVGFVVVVRKDPNEPKIGIEEVYTAEADERKVGSTYLLDESNPLSERLVIHAMSVSPLFEPIYGLLEAYGCDSQDFTFNIVTAQLEPALNAVAEHMRK